MEYKREWPPPTVLEGSTALPRGSRPVMLCELAAFHEDADFYLQAPDGWLDVRLRVYERNQEILAPLLSMLVREASQIEEAAGAHFNSLVFSVRSRAATALVVFVEPLPTVDLAEAKFRLVGRSCCGVPIDQAASEQVSLFAKRHQVVSGTASLVPGVNPILVASPTGGRVALTRLELTADQAAATLIQLQNLGGAPVTLAQWLVAQGQPILAELTYPMRSERGQGWLLLAPGVFVGTIVANATGYQE